MPEMENLANASCQIERILLMHQVEDRECCYSTLEKENFANGSCQCERMLLMDHAKTNNIDNALCQKQRMLLMHHANYRECC